ncbi:PEGA domain-containing protein [Patescibacteria group bacterium]|nr:PEGA domain-containing protein [Patescibacteria group bacterium]MBU1703292.1 PEGA domain-containing protein [Patescibacteria group bacterium]MBU1954021.1 PEGA domain-containing protein [Patescibacteria group bacterium]
MKQSTWRLLLEFFFVTLFLVVTGVTLFFANGYRIDVDEGSVQKTSIIDIVTPKTETEVYLDGEQLAELLPIQIKNVLPGVHDLSVRKEGFTVWSREVEVKEDVVSIVRDVLLVPNDLEPYKTGIVTFNEDEKLIYGDGFIMAVTPGSNLIRAMIFGNRGAFHEEEMDLFRSDFEVLQTYSDLSLFLRFPDKEYAFLDLASRQFKQFYLPETSVDIYIDANGRRVYYLDNSSLYAISFDDLPVEMPDSFDPEIVDVIKSDIENYVITRNGQIFYVSGGTLYLMNHEEDEVTLLDENAEKVKQIALYPGLKYELLLVEYETGEKDLFFYDISKTILRHIRKLETGMMPIGWFDESGHYLLDSGNSVIVADIYDTDDVVLLKDTQSDYVFGKDGALYWTGQGALNRLYWKDEL